MRGGFKSQMNNYACGVLAIQNAIVALGGEADYDDVKRLAGTTSKDGTSTRGVLRALKSLNCKATHYKTRNGDNAWRFARKWATTQPLICDVDQNTHWVVLSGMIDDKMIIIDSGIDASGEEKGVFPYGKEEWLSRWKSRGWYKAIRVSRA